MAQTQTHNVPALRFPEFSREWDSLKLGDIATFSKGKGIPKADIDEDGALECIRYGQLYTDYSETIENVKSKTNVPAKELVLSDANDIIIPASGETQIDIATASCVLKGGIALGGDLNIVKTKHDGVFLSYYLNSTRKYDIARLSQGISVVHLYATQLKTLHLNLPNAPEQQKIASFLSSVDRKIAQLGQKKALLQQYKRGCMQKLFSQELRFKDAQGNDFPDWEEKPIKSFAKVKTGSRDTQNRIENGKYPFYVRSNTIERINSFVYDGEAVLTSGDGVGVGKNIHYVVGKFDYHQRVYAIFKFSANMHGSFFFHFFKEKFLRHVMRLSAKNSVDSVRMSMITDMLVPVPILLEQQKIADFLSATDQKINLVSTELDHAKTFKKGLLQQMFI